MLNDTSQSERLPVISLAPFLEQGTTQSELKAAAEELRRACAEHGFFYLRDHGIPIALTDKVLELARSFFLETPAEHKQAIRRKEVCDGGDGARGYQVLGENVTKGSRDWHEGIDWYSEEFCSGRPAPSLLSDGLLKANNEWPQHPADFEQAYKRYIDEAKQVGTAVLRAMQLALRLDGETKNEFVSKTRNSFWVMRAIGYPPLQAPHPSTPSEKEQLHEGVSCGEHTDYGCVTLLLADSTPGALQVLSRSGRWVNADPIRDALVVNIGDMIERWTNGEWKSTPHRVIHRGDAYRVSVPFFFEPDFDAEVRPLQTCVERTGRQAKFEPLTYGAHLVSKITGNFYQASDAGGLAR